jgi:hypothetical protein
MRGWALTLTARATWIVPRHAEREPAATTGPPQRQPRLQEYGQCAQLEQNQTDSRRFLSANVVCLVTSSRDNVSVHQWNNAHPFAVPHQHANHDGPGDAGWQRQCYMVRPRKEQSTVKQSAQQAPVNAQQFHAEH